MIVEYSRLRKQLGLENDVEVILPRTIKRKIIGSKRFKQLKSINWLSSIGGK